MIPPTLEFGGICRDYLEYGSSMENSHQNLSIVLDRFNQSKLYQIQYISTPCVSKKLRDTKDVHYIKHLNLLNLNNAQKISDTLPDIHNRLQNNTNKLNIIIWNYYFIPGGNLQSKSIKSTLHVIQILNFMIPTEIVINTMKDKTYIHKIPTPFCGFFLIHDTNGQGIIFYFEIQNQI